MENIAQKNELSIEVVYFETLGLWEWYIY
jgi:hypothetical protein